MEFVILGAGISGISAAYHLGLKGIKSVIYEQNNSWGGLCDNFEIDGFKFDKAVHLSFTQDEYVKKLFRESTDIITHSPPSIGSYYQRCWVKHPAQNNLYPLPLDVKVKAICDFVAADRNREIANYEDWLLVQYGNYFAERFPIRYTRKYWTTEAKYLTIDWVGNRMCRSGLEEMLRGAMIGDTPNTYYAQEMRYPKTGGYKAFLVKMAVSTDRRLQKTAILVDAKKKFVEFSDGEKVYYERLISSLPLPDIVRIIKDIPQNMKEAAERLAWSSVALVSLGFNRPDVPQYLWFYIYDEDIYPARAYSPSKKSKDNVPEGCSSLQFEIYFSKYNDLPITDDSLIEHVIEKSIDMGIFLRNDVLIGDCRYLEYGNVIFDQHRLKNRQIILDYLDTLEISSVGRFGEWDYLWSDQSLLSGKRISCVEEK